MEVHVIYMKETRRTALCQGGFHSELCKRKTKIKEINFNVQVESPRKDQKLNHLQFITLYNTCMVSLGMVKPQASMSDIKNGGSRLVGS